MADSVRGVGRVGETGRNSSQGGGVFKRGKAVGHRKEPEDDCIDISREASEKSSEERNENGS